MAKKTKKPNLTEEQKQCLEQCFQQVRDQKLRQWYEETYSENPQVRFVAQARLQLQVWLRDKRSEIATLRTHRDACKASGDNDGIASARKGLKHAQIAMVMHMKMSMEGIPESTASKACRQWSKRTYTLEEILDNADLDKRTEFGIDRESVPKLTAKEARDSNELIEDDLEDAQNNLTNMRLEDGGMIIMAKDGLEATPNSTVIWTQHARHMQQRYWNTSLPDFAIETKLAYQKKLFDQHVNRQSQLLMATKSTHDLCATKAQDSDRDGISKTWNPVLVTTTFSEHNLWELTSPMLWQYFEGSLNWEYSQWVPKGIMRIQTASASSRIYFDFGFRFFSSQSLAIPATITTRTLTFPVQCHKTCAEVDIEINFLAEGFVQVCFQCMLSCSRIWVVKMYQ